ncbi:hypothetical protein [Scytonema sp. NUACC26]|uniref:hypothetical protein n=1 Tax=Scytonema sp. NUACC26 TaxID=3140176 RepID=UPI0034DBCF31
MSKTTGDSLSLEKESLPYKGTDNFETSNAHLPLLPRSGWQNQRAFLSVLVKAKRSLDIAEIAATLWD